MTSILSFCVQIKVKGVEVSIGSSRGELGGISNGSFGIGCCFWYATKSAVLNVKLMPKSSGKSRT